MKASSRFGEEYRRLGLVAAIIAAICLVFFLLVAGTARADQATAPWQTVVSGHEIQAAINGRIDQADADRQAIQTMLQRDDVRQVAGTAGLDLTRASATAATLSGSSLEMLAGQARVVNETGIAGGEGSIVITTTGIIIILLILILLLN